MLQLTLAALAFTGSHMVLSHRNIRGGLIGRLGLWPFRLAYSIVALASFAWLIVAYTEAPVEALFDAHMAFRHMPLSLMFVASVFLVGGYTIINPSAIVLEDMVSGDQIPGILKITRAPIMWGTGLFAFSHMLANPDMASWLFFGSLTFLAIAGGWHLDRRKEEGGDLQWMNMAAQTSFIPFAALLTRRTKLKVGELGWWRLVLAVVLYAAMLAAHSSVIGVSPMPLPK